MLFLIEDIIAGANFCDATDMDPEANSEGQAKAENTLAAECRASKQNFTAGEREGSLVTDSHSRPHVFC